MHALLDNPRSLVEPMHCLWAPSVPIGESWLYEIEWEGCRIIGYKSGSTQHLFSSRGDCLDEEFPEMVQALADLKCNSAIVDAEIVAWDEEGRPSREELHARTFARVLQMAVFDLLMLEGRDVRDRPLVLRRAALAAILPPDGRSMLSFSRELHGPPDRLLARASELCVPGIIAKQRASTYECGACTGEWMRCRAEKAETFLIGGYVPGHDGFEELLIGRRRAGKFRFMARVATGFLPSTRRRIFATLAGLERTGCPFADADLRGDFRWVTPRIAVQVAFADWTPEGRVKLPRFQQLTVA